MAVQLVTTTTERKDGDVYIVIRDGKPANILAHGDGKSVLNGAGAPSNSLGVNGEFYINTTAWEIHGPKAAGIWPAGVTILGAQGEKGDKGDKGDIGEGVPGESGARGATWTSSTSVPLSSAGMDGDFHLITDNQNTVYKKIAGAWVAQMDLKGPSGAKWYGGSGAPSSGDGGDDDWYVDTASGDIYEKVGSTWTFRVNMRGTDFPAASVTVVSGTSYTMTNADFSGNKYIQFSNASAITVTVPAGITNTEPAYLIPTGTGQITVASSGPTLRTPRGAKSALQYAPMSVAPIGSDFYVWGDVTT